MKTFIKIGLPIFCLLAVFLFVDSIRINNKKEQLRLERQKLALNFVNQMNEAQQKYFAKHQKFADSLEGLGLKQPDFKLKGFELDAFVMYDATEKAKFLRHRYRIEQKSTYFGSEVLNYAVVQQNPEYQGTKRPYKNYIGGVFAVKFKNKMPKDSIRKIKYVTWICEDSSPTYDYERDKVSCVSFGPK